MSHYFKIDYKNRIYGLDLFRATAILLVVYSHGRYLLNDTFLSNFPWFKLVDGVDLFFVLSGFLIGSILIKTLQHNPSFGINELFHFWKRRWFRTLPNYYLILLINFLFVKYALIDGDINQFGYTFLFFVHNFSSPFYDFFWESWSLSVEEWFYILLPLLLLVLSRITTTKKMLLTTIIILILFPLFYRIFLSPKQMDEFWLGVTFGKTVLTRLDAIIYGVLASYVKFYYAKFWEKHTSVTFIVGLLLIFVTLNIPVDLNGFFRKTFYYTLISIGAMLLLPKMDSIKKFKGIVGKLVTYISIISYSMYLINLALVSQVIKKNFPVDGAFDGVFKFFIYWIIVLIASSALYFFFERPMMNLRDVRFLKKTPNRTN